MAACAQYESLIAAAVYGDVEPAERAELDRHLAACPACRREIEDLTRVARLVGCGEAELSDEERVRFKAELARRIAVYEAGRREDGRPTAARMRARPAMRRASSLRPASVPAWAASFAAAAALLLVIVGALLLTRSPEPVARETADRRHTLEGGGHAAAAGSSQGAGPAVEPAPGVESRQARTVASGEKKEEAKTASPAVAKSEPKQEAPGGRPAQKEEEEKPRLPEVAARTAPPPPAPVQSSPPAPAVQEKTAAVAAAVARVESAKGEVMIVTESDRTPAKGGENLFAGQGIQTIGPDSLAVVVFPDSTRLELAPDTTVQSVSGGSGLLPATPLQSGSPFERMAAGKRVHLARGTLAADVSKQPAGRTMVFTTPHAEATVLGTRLTLTVTGDSTRLEVREGRVRFTRLSDRASVTVGAGHFAVAAAGQSLAVKSIPVPPRPLLVEDFTDPRALGARWQSTPGGFPTSTAGGRLDIDVSPRPADDYSAGGWHSAGGLRSRQFFPLPLRVTAEVEVTQKHENLHAFITLVPSSTRPGDVKNAVSVKLRGGVYGVFVERQEGKFAESQGSWPRRERWGVELDDREIRLLVDGVEVLRRAHGLTLREPCQVQIGGGAKVDVPPGAHVRFDDVRIEPLER